jgi:hypothetical protein
MTLTLAIIVNAVLMAGLLAAVARVIHLPFRIERGVERLEHAIYLPGRDRDELDRAA